jgi:ABC-type nitrate/sulfonate/bicarbonate transport system ATPase subunit
MTDSSSTPLVQLQDFSLQIGQRPLLKNLRLELEKGKIYSILGRNGAGKTQLLRAIAGLAQKGVLFSGLVRSPEKIGFVFQKPGLIPWMTVVENLQLVHPSTEQISHQLKQFQMQHCRDLFPYQLSVGMQQKINVIRAFLTDCPLVLMDEPFGALDLPQKNDLFELIQKIWSRDRTLLLVTHEIDEALVLSDSIYFLSKHSGQITNKWDVPHPSPRTLQDVRKQEWAARIYGEAKSLLESDLRNENQ